MTVAPLLAPEITVIETVTRHPLNFYESPSWFTTELLRHVKLSGVIGEPCVGHGAIASISLGSVRKFQIKPIGGKPADFWLEHGSLLVMLPGCQSTYLHQVPKTNKVVGTRINLTFRPHVGGRK